MNPFMVYFLKVLRKLFSKKATYPICEKNADKASEIIYNILMKDEPCMITRLGRNELHCIVKYKELSELLNGLNNVTIS